MSFEIDMVEVIGSSTETPDPQAHVVGPELWSFLDQLNADGGLRAFGTRFFAITLDKIEHYEIGTPLTNDQWWALRHGVIDRLITAEALCKTNDMLVLKPDSMPGLQNTQRGTIFPVSGARKLIEKIIGQRTEADLCAAMISSNFFRPQDFIGEFNLNDFKL